ncbi:MAG TPA: carbohydrate ABC transporter permease [Sphaerochaeta sp.]|jgi:multiple sugar transport system permease protein|nr:carbohydrate ABC transporter permease [Sphaerochaeta sp.]
MKKKQNPSALRIVGKYNITEKVLINTLAILLLLLVIFPFYWIILTSFKTPFEIYEVPPKFYPTRLSLFNYIDAFKNYQIGLFSINSLIVTISTVAGTTIASALAAYAIARLTFFGSKHIQALLAASQMFPVVVLLVPLFIFCVRLNLYDSHLSLILPYIAIQTPVSIILQINYFKDIPIELEDAARIDGCSTFQTFTKIMLPLVVSGIVAVSIYTFIQIWQEFLISSSFITTRELFTLTVGLTTFKGEYATEWGALMATSVVIALPAMILFTTSQDFFINRLAGGVKE